MAINHDGPDMHPHCCERRHPFFVKGKQLRREVRNEIKGSGVTESECIKNFNKKVKEKEEDGDHDGVMSRIGTTEALRKTLKKAAKPNFVQHCAPTDIDPELKKSSFFKNFQQWLNQLIGSSFLPLEWMTGVVDYLLDNPPELHELLQPYMATFIEYYKNQWREKLDHINYYDTDDPRTTNGNECFHSSLNTLIPELDFRICYIRYKESFAAAADDYVRSNYGELLKLRELYPNVQQQMHQQFNTSMPVYIDHQQLPPQQQLYPPQFYPQYFYRPRF